jgi:hypothetical protein
MSDNKTVADINLRQAYEAPLRTRIAELEAALLTVREAFDDDAGMAILIDRAISRAALSNTKEDGK